MKDRLAVGVDAGGTASVAAVSRDGAFERSVRGAPANASSRGIEAAAAAIVATVREATAGDEPAALYVGAAGAGRADAASALESALRKAFPTVRLTVADDTRAALRSAVPEGPGVVLIAGTGSVAYAENGASSARVGGLGYLIGDEGSAFAIGKAALELLARSYDGRARADETTALAARALGCSDRDGLLRGIYAQALDVAAVASLAPSILAFAGKGNRASTKIVQSAANDLGYLAKSAATQAGLAESSPAIVLAGGLLRENSLLSFLLEARLTNEIPGATLLRGRDEPARAALRFAEAMLA
jgi:glucosamine kinase